MITRPIVALAAVGLALGLAGCSSADPAATPSAPVSPTQTGGESAAATGAGVASPCSSEEKLALTQVTLTATDTALDVIWESVDPVADAGKAQWDINATSIGMKYNYQMGVELNDGKQTDYYIWDYVGDGGMTKLQGEAQVSGNTVTASFPLSDLPGLEEGFDWTGSIRVKDVAVSQCPDDGAVRTGG